MGRQVDLSRGIVGRVPWRRHSAYSTTTGLSTTSHGPNPTARERCTWPSISNSLSPSTTIECESLIRNRGMHNLACPCWSSIRRSRSSRATSSSATCRGRWPSTGCSGSRSTKCLSSGRSGRLITWEGAAAFPPFTSSAIFNAHSLLHDAAVTGAGRGLTLARIDEASDHPPIAGRVALRHRKAQTYAAVATARKEPAACVATDQSIGLGAGILGSRLLAPRVEGRIGWCVLRGCVFRDCIDRRNIFRRVLAIRRRRRRVRSRARANQGG